MTVTDTDRIQRLYMYTGSTFSHCNSVPQLVIFILFSSSKK